MMNVYGEQLLAPFATPQLEDYSLLAVCGHLFSIFAATFHIWRLFLFCILSMGHVLDKDCIMFPLYEIPIIFRSVLMKP
jgi:hypothetical protein